MRPVEIRRVGLLLKSLLWHLTHTSSGQLTTRFVKVHRDEIDTLDAYALLMRDYTTGSLFAQVEPEDE